MTSGRPPGGSLVSRKGEAKPPPEPAIGTRRAAGGRRVGATLATELYVRFKAHVARNGVTGEQAIAAAIELLLTGAADQPVSAGSVTSQLSSGTVLRRRKGPAPVGAGPAPRYR